MGDLSSRRGSILGVDVDGGGDVPAPGQDGGVRRDQADVRCRHLLPPQAPRVDEEVAVVIGDGDVAGLKPSAARIRNEQASSWATVSSTPIDGVIDGSHGFLII